MFFLNFFGSAKKLALNQLHKQCRSRIHLDTCCPKHGKLARSEITKGYEYEKTCPTSEAACTSANGNISPMGRTVAFVFSTGLPGLYDIILGSFCPIYFDRARCSETCVYCSQDHGVTYGCEAAVGPAVSLMLTSYLFDKPGFMNDPVPETAKNVLIAAHCVSGTRIYGLNHPKEYAPYILRSHSESNLGVSTQVLWPVGQSVTLVQFFRPDALYLDTGTVVGNVNTPPAGGCRTSVEIQMDDIEDCRDVKGFHQVVILGNHRRDVEAFCQLYGINVVHSPRTHEEMIKPV
ncbi:MAG TPA: hypothetical protein VMW72_10620 [Sedimentisphaerales bacterium]|nr:hypothetical protein [Sedimentisphaerales bacterium]